MKVSMFCILFISFFPMVSTCQNKQVLDEFSSGSIRIDAFHESDRHYCWSGTGFFLKVKSSTYLITNNHVVGGYFKREEYNRLKGHSLPQDSVPDYIQFYKFTSNGFSVDAAMILRKSDSLWISFWEDEQSKKGLIDVVAIKMDPKYQTYISHVYSENDIYKIGLFPGTELFVVGYPADLNYSSPLPVWKRGTIASDINSNNSQQGSFFLIDATTRGGMSGSPVLYRGSLIVNANQGLDFFKGMQTFLIGVYNSQNYTMELGGVYKIDKIIQKLQTLP